MRGHMLERSKQGGLTQWGDESVMFRLQLKDFSVPGLYLMSKDFSPQTRHPDDSIFRPRSALRITYMF